MARKLRSVNKISTNEGIEMSMVDKATRLVEEATSESLVLRLLGAIAFRIHCPGFQHLAKEMGRTITDIDFAAHENQRRLITEFFKKREIYPVHEEATALLPRLMLQESSGIKIDVFLDKLEMCHTIDFSKRLELDYPTIPVSDLLLEKLQIVKINEKDIKDVIMLLREHEVTDSGRESIEVGYLSGVLSGDWGFYHTCITNLCKIRDILANYPLASQDKTDVTCKIDAIVNAMEISEKSLQWKMRARLGEKRKWYKDVEDVVL